MKMKMMSEEIRHHLPESVMAAYSAGTLPEAYSLVVACHVSICDACRATLSSYDAVGGALLQDTDTVVISDDALAKTMALIAEMPMDEPVGKSAGSEVRDPLFPQPLQDYVGGGVDDVKWKRVGGGVRQAILADSEGATARLLYIPAGMAVPDHGHRGLELTMVLQGAFSDEVDRFKRGDVEVGNEDLEHTPIADAGEDCICLAATDAPLVFNSFLPRLLQPFLKI